MKWLMMCAALLGLGGMSDSNVPTVDSLETAALKARTDIKTIYVELQTEVLKSELPSGLLRENRKIWLDEAKIRGEILREVGPDSGFRLVHCIDTGRGGTAISGWHKKGVATRVEPYDPKSRARFEFAIDPRLLGYYPMPFLTLHQFRLDGIVGNPARGDVQVERATLNGTDCWRMEWVNNKKVSVRVWVSPLHGYNVLRIDLHSADLSGDARNTLVSEVESELRLEPNTKFWYPGRVVLKKYREGKVVFEEHSNVSAVQINQPIPPETFTLPGLGLPDGTYVQSRNKGESGFLTGEEVVPVRQATKSPFEVAVEPENVVGPPRINYYLVAGSIFCFALAVGIFFKRRKVSSN